MVRRRTSSIVIGVICPEILGTSEVGVCRTRPSQGNGALGGSVGSEERATHLSESRNHLYRSGNKAPRCLTPHDGEIRGECEGVFLPCIRSEDGFESHTRLLNKHAKKGFAMFRRWRLRTYRMRRRVAFRRPSKQAWRAFWREGRPVGQGPPG